MIQKLNRHTAGVRQQRLVKVLQFGEGNFLRAFCDWIIDIANERMTFDGAVQVVQPISQGMAELINGQGALYHVVLNGILKGKEVREIRMITCLSSVVNPYDSYKDFLALGENSALQFVVSNTTEAGIAFDERDGSMETLPHSFPGKVATFLHHRFKHFAGDPAKGLVFLPCELIERNGEALRDCILQYARLWKLPGTFTSWVERHNHFCNTLVDRIVPGFPKETIQAVQQETGFEDNLVVMAEPFHLWIIQAPDEVRSRLPFDGTGLDIRFVSDLTPYRTRKVRILNGVHTAMVPVAYLRGLRTVRQAVEDPFTGDFIRKALAEEIVPTLDLPAAEVQGFADEVLERFQNPFIEHQLSSIALNSISKFKVRVLPSLVKYIELKGQLPSRLLDSLAALILFYRGTWNGESLPVNDTMEVTDFFTTVWATPDPDRVVREALRRTDFWGSDLTRYEGLADYLISSLRALLGKERSPTEGIAS